MTSGLLHYSVNPTKGAQPTEEAKVDATWSASDLVVQAMKDGRVIRPGH